MSILDRSTLEASPLADLHAIASELSIDGYRRLRRAELISAVLDKQSGTETASGSETSETETTSETEMTSGSDTTSGGETPSDADEEPPRRTRSRRTKKSEEDKPERPAKAEKAERTEKPEKVKKADQAGKSDDDEDEEESSSRRRRGRRGGRGRGGRDEAAADEKSDDDTDDAEDGESVEGVVELLAGGSGFVRVAPPEPSDDDVYISSAQVKRCELVSGDRVTGPKRAPRRSERFASLIRIETINGRPAAELADTVRFDDLPAAFPEQRFKLGSDDPTLKAIEFLTPFGRGSRVTIVGAARAGKSEALRRIALSLSADESLSLHVVLAGARPEELTEWSQGPLAPVAAVGLATSEDVRNGTIEPVIDQARRLAARGSDAVVLIDTLDGCSPQLARKALGAARNIVDGGSLTVIAVSSLPLGGETTVIALDVALASLGRFPALDLLASGVMRPERLVGQAGADAIARARADVSDPEDD